MSAAVQRALGRSDQSKVANFLRGASCRRRSSVVANEAGTQSLPGTGMDGAWRLTERSVLGRGLEDWKWNLEATPEHEAYIV